MLQKSPSILIYNWCRYDTSENLASGLGIICRKLIEFFLHQKWQVTFLYSGIDYAFPLKTPYIQRYENKRDPSVAIYSIVNSPVPAPAFLAFDIPHSQSHHTLMASLLTYFFSVYGPFDAIHFLSLEGLSANCIGVAKKMGIRTIHTIGNYWLLCPQVNLWQKNQKICTDYQLGKACVTCQPNHFLHLQIWRRIGSINSILSYFHLFHRTSSEVIQFLSRVWLIIGSILPNHVTHYVCQKLLNRKFFSLPRRPYQYYQRREKMCEEAKNLDYVIFISDRSREIHNKLGFTPINAITTPMEGPHLPPKTYNLWSPQKAEKLKIVFLGKLEKEKGLGFLISELLLLEKKFQRKISFSAFGKTFLNSSHTRWIHSLKRSEIEVEKCCFIHHEDLFKHLSKMHLGIIPSLCEEVGPIVIWDLLAAGVAVIGSNRGGIPALIDHPHFLFEPDQKGTLATKIQNILEDPSLLSQFWEKQTHLPNPISHFNKVFDFAYRSLLESPNFLSRSKSNSTPTQSISYPLVYAIVLNYQSAFQTVLCIKALRASCYPNLKIIIVDNNSSIQGEKELHALLPNEEVIQTHRNAGYGDGNNHGISLALARGAEFVWIVTPDVTVEPNCLSQLIKTMTVHKKTGICGPAFDMGEKTLLSWKLFPKLGYLITPNLLYKKKDKETKITSKKEKLLQENLLVDFVDGGAILIRSTVFSTIDVFLSIFFLYLEECEFCLRAKELGWEIRSCLSAKAKTQDFSRERNRRYYYLTRNSIILARIRRRYRIITLFRALFISPLRALYLGHNPKNIFSALWEGIQTPLTKPIETKK